MFLLRLDAASGKLSVNDQPFVATRKRAGPRHIAFHTKMPFAYVVKSDQSVEQRPLKTGYSHQGLSIIEEGLASGDQVVLDGQYKLRAGTRVQARPNDKAAKPVG